MPPGTPAKGVLQAARNFAREEFALKHRYALVLHTDEPHPHVHVVVKAVSEQGVRLNIKKATLRGWRWEFARHLRLLGIDANATERPVRGGTRKALKDGIYRASRRGASTYLRSQAEDVAHELTNGGLRTEAGKRTLEQTRNDVRTAWLNLVSQLETERRAGLAKDVRRYVNALPPVETDRERLAEELSRRVHRSTVREVHIPR
jgi:hypothetical protein